VHGSNKKLIQKSVVKPERRDHLEDPSVGEKMTLEWIAHKESVWVWIGFNRPRKNPDLNGSL
jgi:hypothetical protein